MYMHKQVSEINRSSHIGRGTPESHPHENDYNISGSMIEKINIFRTVYKYLFHNPNIT